MHNQHKQSTKRNYHGVWQNFNKFVIQLDVKPDSWEERTSLYCTFLTQCSTIQSSTLKSYISAIKFKVNSLEDYVWNDELVSLHSLTRACKIKNDVQKVRLPIRVKFLEEILFETERYFTSRNLNYEKCMFKTAFAMAYYGMMRIGELTLSEHAVKAKDVHISKNKKKLLAVLYSSKTHGRNSKPQQIEIEPDHPPRIFCPVEEANQFSNIRPGYLEENEQFLVYPDRQPLTSNEVRSLLRKLIGNLKLDATLYDTHSFRIGRATDLFKWGVSVEKIKKRGRWESNAVYQYLRN